MFCKSEKVISPTISLEILEMVWMAALQKTAVLNFSKEKNSSSNAKLVSQLVSEKDTVLDSNTFK